MAIARSVRENAQRADEMIAQLSQQGQQEGEPTDGATPTLDQQADSGNDDNAAQHDQGAGEEFVQDFDGAQDQGADAPQDSGSDVEARLQQMEAELQEARKWEQRYRSLDGMIKSRDNQIESLHNLIAGMQQAQANGQQGDSGDGATQESYLTDEDTRNFGSDMVDMARRAAREEGQQMMSAMRQEIDKLRKELSGVSKTAELSVTDRFESKLDQITEGRWRDLNVDQNFIDWLKSAPARFKVFQAGVQGKDATTVGDLFNEYHRATAAQQQEQERPRQERREKLQKQVAPGKSKSVGNADARSGEKKTWTRSEIASVYANKKQYGASEFNKLEREIAAAQREGRVDYAR